MPLLGPGTLALASMELGSCFRPTSPRTKTTLETRAERLESTREEPFWFPPEPSRCKPKGFCGVRRSVRGAFRRFEAVEE